MFHVEHGDESPTAFSFVNTQPVSNAIVCHLVHTNEQVHAHVRENIQHSPLFNGQIAGIGPDTVRPSKTR